MRQVLERLALTLKELVIAVPTIAQINEIVGKLHEYQETWSALREHLRKGTKLKQDYKKIMEVIDAVKRDGATMDITSASAVSTFKELQAYSTILDEYIEHSGQFQTLCASVHTMLLRLIEMSGNIDTLDKFRQGDLAILLSGIALSQLFTPPLEQEPVLDVDPDVSMDIHRYRQEVSDFLRTIEQEKTQVLNTGVYGNALSQSLEEAIKLMKDRREQEKQRLAEQLRRLTEND